jgi:transposase
MLLQALQAASTPEWLQTLPAVTTLRTMWEQQFEPFEQGGRWRQEPLLPAAQLLTSPYDLDASNGKKRSTFWTGYKVHFTKAL